MSHQLLFVCTANVCRSPLMAGTFVQSAAERLDRSDWTVLSRGTSAVREHAMCTVAASLIGGDSYGTAFASSHVSTQVIASELESQDLVIVASREERSRIARLLPSARTRTFTLKEAVVLGRLPVDAAERERVLSERATGGSSLDDYAAFLDQRRGRDPDHTVLADADAVAEALRTHSTSPTSTTQRAKRHARTLKRASRTGPHPARADGAVLRRRSLVTRATTSGADRGTVRVCAATDVLSKRSPSAAQTPRQPALIAGSPPNPTRAPRGPRGARSRASTRRPRGEGRDPRSRRRRRPSGTPRERAPCASSPSCTASSASDFGRAKCWRGRAASRRTRRCRSSTSRLNATS